MPDVNPQSSPAEPYASGFSPTPCDQSSVGAVVVAYFPDGEFEDRLRRLLPQVSEVLVVDNTPEGNCKERLKAMGRRLHVADLGTNVGVAAALNHGLKWAVESQHRWLLTLDQDTLCYPDMVQTLLKVQASCALEPAIVGANYFDPRSGRTEVPEQGNDWLEQITVITSGSLIDVAVADSVGGFREDYFIDQLDHEFCLRVRRHGRRVIMSRKPLMSHSIGGPAGTYVPLWGPVPHHAALRKYYITRNSLVTIADYWRNEPGWCARRLTRLLLGLGLIAVLESDRVAKVRAFAAGAVDGVRRRMGPCRWRSLYA